MRILNFNQIDLKRVGKKVNLIIPAQSAKLTPPVGPILGQVKIKVKDFCTLFNDATSSFKIGLPLPVVVFVFKNERKDDSENQCISRKGKPYTLPISDASGCKIVNYPAA